MGKIVSLQYQANQRPERLGLFDALPNSKGTSFCPPHVDVVVLICSMPCSGPKHCFNLHRESRHRA